MSEWETDLMGEVEPGPVNPHYACGTVNSPPCPGGIHPAMWVCPACGNGTPVEQPCQVCAYDPRTVEVREPDQFDRFAAGEVSAAGLTCVLCLRSPCRCTPFGSAAYNLRTSFRHGLAYVGPAVVCRHCGAEIELTDGGIRWRHLSTETSTGTRHISCGFGGELGTAAEPTDD